MNPRDNTGGFPLFNRGLSLTDAASNRHIDISPQKRNHPPREVRQSPELTCKIITLIFALPLMVVKSMVGLPNILPCLPAHRTPYTRNS